MKDKTQQPASHALASDAQLDAILRSAMTARPEPVAPADLAERAMKMAGSLEVASFRLDGLDQDFAANFPVAGVNSAVAQRLARQRRWVNISGIAATLLIVAMLAGAAQRMWARGDITAIASAVSSDTTSSSTSDSTSSSSSSSSTNTVFVVFLAEFLVLGVILASMNRGGSKAPWGSAAAGLW